jgi:DNA ligase-1
MEYLKLADTYERLEKESGKLKKVDILAELFSATPTDSLGKVVILSTGKIFPSYSEMKTGIANKMMIKAISKTSGVPEGEIMDNLKELGDLGLVAEKCMKGKKQDTLFKKELTVESVYENLHKLPDLNGMGAYDRKIGLISELISSSKPKETKYIVRTILETLRVGVAEGIVRDAIAKSFDVDPKAVEGAWFIKPDYGEIATIAKKKGEKGLNKIEIEVGKPIMVMLGEKGPELEDAVGKYGNFAAEWKFDGVRLQIHKSGDKVWLFSRRLENVTDQFPEMVEWSRTLRCENCIIEGECVAIDKSGDPMPFQQLSRRVQRKYDIKEMVKKIPVRFYIFDLVYLDSKSLLDDSFEKRRGHMEKVVKDIPKKFELVKQLKNGGLDEVREFYGQSLRNKQEGIFIKNLDAKYQPGRRVGSWIKIKPILEPLDLVITGAEWGKGKRSNWLSSVELSCFDPENSRFLECGKLGTGMTDEQFKGLTKKLKSLVVKEEGTHVKIRPEIVVEVGYEEIQKSPKYSSGFALRFPRLMRFRDDEKKAEDADTIGRLETIFKQQFTAG